MDRLTKALEKARADRASAPQTTGTPLSASGASLNIRGPQSIPDVKSRPVDSAHLAFHRVLTGGGASNEAATTAFKLLRTQVLQRMRSNGWHTLVVTSPGQGNGKTVTAINLALNLAKHAHQSVLLVDLDLRRPSVYRYLTDQPGPGISDYIHGYAGIEEILFSPGVEGLTVLPGREPFADSAEALLRPTTVSLLDGLLSRYSGSIVILDMPPVLAVDDVVAFSSHWDAFLLVVEEGRTTDYEVRKSLELLKAKPILGTVLTKSQDVIPDYLY